MRTLAFFDGGVGVGVEIQCSVQEKEKLRKTT
jgi:hypothetical protein